MNMSRQQIAQSRPFLAQAESAQGQPAWRSVYKEYLTNGAFVVKDSKLPAKFTEDDWTVADAAVEQTFASRAVLTKALMDDNLKLDASGYERQTLEIVTLPPSPSPPFTPTTGDVLPHSIESLPLATTYKDFTGPRSSFGVFPLDTVAIEMATRHVAEKVDESVVESLRLKAHACPVRVLEALRREAMERNFHGPYLLLYGGVIDIRTVRRWKDMKNVKQTLWCRALQDREVILVQTTPDVIRLVMVLLPVLIQREDHWRVLCSITPQVCRDVQGDCGVVRFAVQERNG